MLRADSFRNEEPFQKWSSKPHLSFLVALWNDISQAMRQPGFSSTILGKGIQNKIPQIPTGLYICTDQQKEFCGKKICRRLPDVHRYVHSLCCNAALPSSSAVLLSGWTQVMILNGAHVQATLADRALNEERLPEDRAARRSAWLKLMGRVCGGDERSHPSASPQVPQTARLPQKPCRSIIQFLHFND